MEKTEQTLNDCKELLTVRKLATFLLQEDMDAVVGIENNGYPYTTTLMNGTWKSGDFFMNAMPRIQKEYFMADELTKSQRDKMVKVLVIGAIISKDEIKGGSI